jgi:hypothetical protein
VRRDDGTWLLTGEPLTEGTAASEVIRQRRRLMPAPGAEPRDEPAVALTEAPDAELHREVRDRRLSALRDSLEAAHQAATRNAAAVEALAEQTSVLQQLTIEMRAERAERLTALRAAALRRGEHPD